MGTVRRVSEHIGNVLETVIALFFVVILVVTLLLVSLRYGLNTSIKGGHELTNYLFIYTTALGAAVSVGRHEHIKIDYFINRLAGTPRRVADIVVQLLIALINGYILYLSASWIRQVGSFVSPVLRIPNWMVEISIPIGAACAMLFCALNIARDLTGDAYTEGERDALTPR